jgi:hypothetical protein
MNAHILPTEEKMPLDVVKRRRLYNYNFLYPFSISQKADDYGIFGFLKKRKKMINTVVFSIEKKNKLKDLPSIKFGSKEEYN